MKRVGCIFFIYLSIIYAICTGFKIESYRGFLLILAIFFFVYWNIVSSDFFHEHKLLYPIQFIQYFIFAGYVFIEGRQLLRGGAVVLNYFFDIVNQTFYRQFTYYLNVNEETAQSDMVIFCVIILALYSGILVISRRYSWLVALETMPVMLLIIVFAPQAVHADVFLYLAGMAGLYYLEHDKLKMATFMFGALALVAIFFEVYPSTEIFGQKMSNVRQGTQVVFEYINHIINGEQSVFQLNFGDLKSKATKENDSNAKATISVKSGRDVVLLRSYIGEKYKDGKWTADDQSPKDFSLLENREQLSDLKIDGFQPSVKLMQISYVSEELRGLLYPYYTISEERTGEMECFLVGDYGSFLLKAEEIKEAMMEQEDTKELMQKQYQSAWKQNNMIPKNLQKKLKTLAKEIKADTSNDTEVIQNLISYLKEHYTYTANAGMTPEEEDPADNFLFQSMRGDCAQYASATVLLLRSCGIPARYVEGYRLGEEDFKDATITNGKTIVTLTDDHAYAWTEVYAQGIGWIPFDSVPRESLVAASDAREIELPSLPRLTMSPKELIATCLKVFSWLCLLCILRVVFLHFLVRHRKKNMTRNERIQWYARVWDRYCGQSSQSEQIIVERIIERARYSNHELSEDDEETVLRAAQKVRDDYRYHLPFFMSFFDLFIACRDIL